MVLHIQQIHQLTPAKLLQQNILIIRFISDRKKLHEHRAYPLFISYYRYMQYEIPVA